MVLKALLVCPDQALAEQFNGIMAGQPGIVVDLRLQDYPTPVQLSEGLEKHRFDVVLIDVGSDCERAVGLIDLVSDTWAQISVMALNRDNDPDVILRCLRSGCSEFLSHPFTANDLSQAVERIIKRNPVAGAHPVSPSLGEILAFAPVKGSSGATTIAANVAWQIQKAGGKVLLADFNLPAGLLSFIMRSSHQYTVMDALKHSAEMDEALWRSIVVRCHDMDILLAPERPEPAIVEPYPVQALLDYARTLYEYVVVDLGGVCQSMSMASLSATNGIHLVCTPELPSLLMMRRTIALVQELGYPHEHIHVIVNRVPRRSDLSTADMEKIFRSPVRAAFPEDPAGVQKALRDGAPLAGNCGLSKSIRKFVATFVERKSPRSERAQGSRSFRELLTGT